MEPSRPRGRPRRSTGRGSAQGPWCSDRDHAATIRTIRMNIPQPVRIVIADDHPLFRDGLRTLLESEARFVVVGEAGNAQAAVEAVRLHNPDILLLDLVMPGASGLETLRM